MQDQINEVLELAKSISSQSAERNEIVDQLVKRLETMETETVQKAAVQAEFEEMKKQLADIQEQQMNIQLKGNINMSETIKNVDFRETLVKAIAGAGMNEDVLTKANGMSVADEASAGITVRPQYEAGVVRQAVNASPFMSKISKVSSKNEKFIRTLQIGKAGLVWTSEDSLNAGGQGNTAVAGYKQVEGFYGQAEARPYTTSQIRHDSDLSIVDEIMTQVSDAYTEALPQVLLTGDGVKKPKGLLTFRVAGEKAKADGVRAHNAVQEIEVAIGDVATEAMVNALEDLIASLNQAYYPGASMLMNPRIYSQLLKIRDKQGRSYLRPELADAAAPTLCDFPVVTDYNMPDTFKVGEVAIVFGDLSKAFSMIEVEGMTMIVDPYTKKPNVEYLHTQRIGSIQGNLSAVKFLTIKA